MPNSENLQVTSEDLQSITRAKDIASRRLEQAKDRDEIVLWTQVLGELARQEQAAKELDYKIWRGQAEFKWKRNLSLIGLTIGSALVIGSITAPVLFIPGMFMLGVGSYPLAPSFVREYFNKKRGADEE
jgi:hypothetical protein